MITKAKKVIPSTCRICNTLFTQMSIIENMINHNKDMPNDVDKDDYITVLFHLGFPPKYQETNYYSN